MNPGSVGAREHLDHVLAVALLIGLAVIALASMDATLLRPGRTRLITTAKTIVVVTVLAAAAFAFVTA